MVRDINNLGKQVSNRVRKEIDEVLKGRHFNDSKVSEILGIAPTTYKSYRSKGVLNLAHLNEVVNYFIDYDKAMKTMNRIK